MAIGVRCCHESRKISNSFVIKLKQGNIFGVIHMSIFARMQGSYKLGQTIMYKLRYDTSSESNHRNQSKLVEFGQLYTSLRIAPRNLNIGCCSIVYLIRLE